MTSNGLRMFLIFYVFGFFVIFTNYKAAMVSYSAIPVVPSPIGFLEDSNICHCSLVIYIHIFRYLRGVGS